MIKRLKNRERERERERERVPADMESLGATQKSWRGLGSDAWTITTVKANAKMSMVTK